MSALLRCTLLVLVLFNTTSALMGAEATWTIQPGDRIVFLGGTFVERENSYGLIELSLRTAFPKTPFTFRNLGWSGDNIQGESRAYFGPVADGYKHLLEYVTANNPTLLLVCYGQHAAFTTLEQQADFIAAYEKLLQDLAAPDRRIVVVGPPLHEAVFVPESVVSQRNAMTQHYVNAISEMCARRNIAFVDLTSPLEQLKQEAGLKQLTENGIHFNRDGYIAVGEVLCRSAGKTLRHEGEFLLQDSQFQAAAAPVTEQILWKNELYFHRFRPQNETYLRGFRKHEQGQNAREIYEFDAIVDSAEQKLQSLAEKTLPDWSR